MLLFLALFCCICTSQQPFLVNPCLNASFASLPFCNPTLSEDDRVANVLSRLSLDEKIGLLGTSGVALPSLGVPAYQWWSEATHGASRSMRFDEKTPWATNFVFPITSCQSFNTTLWRATGHQIGMEAKAFANAGNAYSSYWAPVINLAREPRWGRNIECAGEDPLLSGAYAAAFVDGMQHSESFLLSSACCKHFAANSMEFTNQNGLVWTRHNFSAAISSHDLVDSYLLPFQTCVEVGKVSSLMCSYNAINGVPSCANEWLLSTARNAWRFEGYITSDCGAVDDVFEHHHFTNSTSATVRAVLQAGTDVDCGTFLTQFAAKALQDGSISEADIDARLRNQFRVRFRLGHFDASPLDRVGTEVICSAQGKQIAREGLIQGAVLLKNEDQMLPISDASLSFAAIGPNTNLSKAIASYYGPRSVCDNAFNTVYDAIQQYAKQEVKYAAGTSSVLSNNVSMIPEAVQIASSVDVTFLVVGTDLTWAREGQDAKSIVFNEGQASLIREVAAVAKKCVLILLTATPLDLTDILKNPSIQAVVHAGQPSVQTLGLGDLIFGHRVFSGRLSQTILPASYVDQISIFDFNMRPGASPFPRPDCTLQPQSSCKNGTNPGRTYRYYTGEPVAEFGFGLSYSSFHYEVLNSSTTTVRLPPHRSRLASLEQLSQQVAEFQVNVTNAGPYDASTSVLGFIRPPPPSVLQKSLFGFERIHLKVGETKTVFIYPRLMDVTHVMESGERRLLHGTYSVEFGIALDNQGFARANLSVH